MIISRTNFIPSINMSNVAYNIGFCRAKNNNYQDTFTPSYKMSSKEVKFVKMEMNKFPEDVQYRKKLLIDMGINPSEYYKLRSIIGIDEFKSAIKELDGNGGKSYKPGERPLGKESVLDSYGLENLKSGVFRANFHIHSNNSDGKLSVQEILDSAVEYADNLKKTKNKPFYIAITDHNTVEGCKEAIEIIRQNPKKYQNLRVILGSELSLKLESIGDFELKKPQSVHLLAMCLNPYDKKLSEFLDDFVENKNNPMEAKFITLNDGVNALSNQKYCGFALAHPAWPYLPNIMKKPEFYLDAMKQYIKTFANIAKDRILYMEVHYQSYDSDIAEDTKLLKTVEKTTQNLGINSAGGIDTHGKSIFYNK